jgi:hypothetical protein
MAREIDKNPTALSDAEKGAALLLAVDEAIDAWSSKHFHQVRGLDRTGDEELIAALKIIFANFVAHSEG